MLLEVPPKVFGRVEFGSVTRKVIHEDLPSGGLDEASHESAAVDAGRVPDDQQATAEMATQVFEKGDDLRTSNRAVLDLKVEVEKADASDQREALPVEVKLKHRSLASGRPGADAMRAQAQAALIDENDHSSLVKCFFFSSGQRWRFHVWMAFSLRSMARAVGRWQLHPSLWRRR